jgi:hypothetical protein
MGVEELVECELAGENLILELKPTHNATLSTTNPTSSGLRPNQAHRGGKPFSNSLSYGMAYHFWLLEKKYLITTQQGE